MKRIERNWKKNINPTRKIKIKSFINFVVFLYPIQIQHFQVLRKKGENAQFPTRWVWIRKDVEDFRIFFRIENRREENENFPHEKKIKFPLKKRESHLVIGRKGRRKIILLMIRFRFYMLFVIFMCFSLINKAKFLFSYLHFYCFAFFSSFFDVNQIDSTPKPTQTYNTHVESHGW